MIKSNNMTAKNIRRWFLSCRVQSNYHPYCLLHISL